MSCHDDGDGDTRDEMSQTTAMQTTLTLLLRYQRLLVSRFITHDDKTSRDVTGAAAVDDILAGICNEHEQLVVSTLNHCVTYSCKIRKNLQVLSNF